MDTDHNNKSVAKVILVFFGLVIFFVGGFYLGRLNLFNSAIVGDGSKNYEVTGDLKSQYKEVNVNLLWEVWSMVDQQYLNKNTDGQSMLYGAVKGLVAGLDDPYTAFLTPDETQDYLSSNKGEFEGIGTTLKQDGDYVAVESPVDGSPAKAAGLLPGDIILEVDGQDMQGISVYEVASKIRGEAGTEVKLALFRPDDSKKFDVVIKREKIDIDNIALEELEDGIYKIKIYKFTEESVQAFNGQWDEVIKDLIQKNPKGIVIDLRNNPGGYVNSVEYVLGEFLPKGTKIFSEEDRNGNKTPHNVNRSGKLMDIPLVVMVNEGSASASEIFAGAIQDHDRGKIIGAQTVGKGVEQRLLTLSDGSTLQLVFQKWLTPDGRNISKDEPIKPDMEVKEYEEQDKAALEETKKQL